MRNGNLAFAKALEILLFAFTVAIAIATAASSPSVVIGNISYNTATSTAECRSGCTSCRCLDIVLPAARDAAAAALPFVVLLHGGLWFSGSRLEMRETCENIVTQSTAAGTPFGCVTADYVYSQDLGGTCFANNCTSTALEQAREASAAFAFVTNRTAMAIAAPGVVVDTRRVILGGHSAGGHLSALLAFNWSALAATPPNASPSSARPVGFVSVEGIHNVSMWETYDEAHWRGKFHCSTVQAFCADLPAWDRGSPSLYALHATPIAPLLLIHSMQDDWVQASQATQLYDRLKPSGGGGSVLDVKGRCVFGQHEDVLSGKSAAMLATCILQFAAAT